MASPPVPPRSPLRPPPRVAGLDDISLSVQILDLTLSDETKRRSSTTESPPLTLSPMEEEPISSSSASSASVMTTPGPSTKRQHALHELLASERAYASDLALVKEVYIPLALGPMTLEDIKIIFSNIVDLAHWAEHFCDCLEKALGALVGGDGEDCVGELFLQKLPSMEQPYKHYITRQATADEHLQALPRTPELEGYFQQTRAISCSISHAWDLHSLLIKPVQRLLKYPLLLSTIVEETPADHPDKANLVAARAKIEELARSVNEDRRRAEIVKGVLTAKKRSGPSVGAAQMPAAVLSKMKAIRSRSGEMQNEEARRVAEMQSELHRIEAFAQTLAKNVLEWARTMGGMMAGLRTWSESFAKVIGLTEDQGSEAFDAFMSVITEHLVPLGAHLELIVNEQLLREIAYLLRTMAKPLKLLASMDEQEPFHSHLLNMNMQKNNRPPPALLEASKNYLALRGQLAAELPRYLELVHQGLGTIVRKLAAVQAQFWGDVRDRWRELWEMLRVEGEMNAGAAETVSVWHTRWVDVDEVLASLKICSPPVIPRTARSVSRSGSRHRHSYAESINSSKTPTSKSVASKLASLDAFSMPGTLIPAVSMPYPLSPTSSTRSGGSGSYSESPVKSRSSVTTEAFGEYVAVMSVPAIPRTKSMPLDKASTRDSRRRRDSSPPPAYRKPGIRRQITETLTRQPSQHSHSSSVALSHISNSSSASSGSSSGQSQDPTDWKLAPSLYLCKAVHPCKPPAKVVYMSFPFFTLREGEMLEILYEAGHPNRHPKMPLYVDDGEDCLLLCRDEDSNVGWALASFLEPLS